MFGFGNKKKDEDEKAEKEKQEQVGQAMRNMSDQIGAQAREIKELQEKLSAATKDDADDQKALREAQAKMRAMQAEMERMKSAAAKAGAPASGSAMAGTVGVTKIGPKADAPAPTLGGAAEPAAPAASGGLTIGGTAFVRQTGGKNLRLRNGPGLSTNAFAGLAPGTSMTLLEGPIELDGYPWYRIRTVDGQEGWVAGSELVTHPE